MNEEINIPIKKVIGQVIETENNYNFCSCGRTVVMQACGAIEDGKILRDTIIGLCECGNVFRTKPLKISITKPE